MPIFKITYPNGETHYASGIDPDEAVRTLAIDEEPETIEGVEEEEETLLDIPVRPESVFCEHCGKEESYDVLLKRRLALLDRMDKEIRPYLDPRPDTENYLCPKCSVILDAEKQTKNAQQNILALEAERKKMVIRYKERRKKYDEIERKMLNRIDSRIQDANRLLEERKQRELIVLAKTQ